MTENPERASVAVNARYELPNETCSAVTKYRGAVAICDLAFHHQGSHRATLPDTTTYEWVEEPW